MPGLRPLIVVCGTTGVGKSNLAIDLSLHLARRAPGSAVPKVINADAMQVYAGMDVITNKVPETERCGVQHLLMGFRQPGEQYVVGQWVRDASKLIEHAHQNSEVPVVVGGTSYWIQNLIFPNRLVNEDPVELKVKEGSSIESPSIHPRLQAVVDALPASLRDLFETLSEPPNASDDPDGAFALHQLLAVLDPQMALRWHWKDTRKVHRSLCIIKETGRPASESITEQSQSISRPRYRTLFLWIYMRNDVLYKRLNLRVDRMFEQGLLEEVRVLEQLTDGVLDTYSNQQAPDYCTGIYQSIGYREFHEYIKCPSDEGLVAAIEKMKISTRQYAKRQMSWIRNKLLPALDAANREEDEPSSFTYLLDATDDWEKNVREPTLHIVNRFLDGEMMPDPLSLSAAATQMLTVKLKNVDPQSILHARRKLVCPACTVDQFRPVMIEEGKEWEAHQRSRSHRRLAKKQNEEQSTFLLDHL